jgi:16S rRNA (guanine966-N2)-methyltransferase
LCIQEAKYASTSDEMKGKGRKQQGKPGTVRIIAGTWRGRRLPVPEVEGLRPSGDRGRETLFNWLQPHLFQARCIDLFAGTGVLGLEAVSRGASEAVLVEKSSAAVGGIRQNIEYLGAGGQVSVVTADALSWVENQPPHSADIVLADPPFGHSMAQMALHRLDKADVVRPGGIVYLESSRSEPVPAAGPRWQNIKEKILGEVRMQLFLRLQSGLFPNCKQ